jgi:hypothetical protein
MMDLAEERLSVCERFCLAIQRNLLGAVALLASEQFFPGLPGQQPDASLPPARGPPPGRGGRACPSSENRARRVSSMATAMATASSSPAIPDTTMNGISWWDSRRIASAACASNWGRW